MGASANISLGSMKRLSTAHHPQEKRRPRSLSVDDPRLWDSRPQLSREEFTLEGLSDEEWDAFHKIIAEA